MAAEWFSAERLLRSFVVESKTFDVECHGGSSRITERRSGFLTFVHYPRELNEWFVQVFEGLERKREGFIGKSREGNMSVVAYKKSNSKGRYCTLMFVSPQLKKGPKFIVIPEGVQALGWKNMKETMQVMLGGAKHKSAVIQQQVNNGQQRVIVRNAFQGDVDRLSRCGVVATVTKDVGKMVELPNMAFRSCELSITRWRPASMTIKLSWLKSQRRNVDLHGIPMHLINDDVLKELVKGFGKFSRFERRKEGFGGISMVRVTVDNCLLINMPQVLTILDEGVQYPVRVIPDSDSTFGNARNREDDGLVTVTGVNDRWRCTESSSGERRTTVSSPTHSVHEINTTVSDFPPITFGNRFSSLDIPENQQTRLASRIFLNNGDHAVGDIVGYSTVPRHQERTMQESGDLPIGQQESATQDNGDTPIGHQESDLQYNGVTPIGLTCQALVIHNNVSGDNCAMDDIADNSLSKFCRSDRNVVVGEIEETFNESYQQLNDTQIASDTPTREDTPVISESWRDAQIKVPSAQIFILHSEVPVSIDEEVGDILKSPARCQSPSQDDPLAGSEEEVSTLKTLPVFQFASAEDDGLVYDSGEDSDHLPEEEIVPVITQDPDKHADSIANALAEIHKILGLNSDDPSITKKERAMGTRLKRKKKRAALLLKAEEMIASS